MTTKEFVFTLRQIADRFSAEVDAIDDTLSQHDHLRESVKEWKLNAETQKKFYAWIRQNTARQILSAFRPDEFREGPNNPNCVQSVSLGNVTCLESIKFALTQLEESIEKLEEQQ